MGIQPFLIPASFNIVIAQRLLRRLCPHCKTEIGLNEIDKETL
jgi:type II secretory ATPase GspE/PulE/Tfp pilus assembly ATPase PilB-like protein